TISTDTGTTLTYNGIIAGTDAFTKTGLGTLLLGGANTYGGTTTVSSGVLKAGVANTLPTVTALSVSGGNFDLNGFAQQVGSVTGSSSVTNSGAAAIFTVNNGSA